MVRKVLYVLYLYSDNTHKDKTVTWNQDTTDVNSTVAVNKAADDSTTAADSAEDVDKAAEVFDNKDPSATIEKKDRKDKKVTKKNRNKTIRDPMNEALAIGELPGIKEAPATEEFPGIKEAPATEELPGLDKDQIIHQQNQVIKNIKNQ